MLKKVTVITLIAVTLLQFMADAQSFYAIRRDRTLIAMLGSGTSTYFGELSNPGDYMDTKPNLDIGLQYFIGDRVSVRAEVCWFQLQGSDAKADDGSRQRRNLSFISNNYEFSLTGTVNLMPLGNRFYQRPKLNVYGFAGLGMMYFNPKAELNGEKHALQPLMTEGVKYSRLQPVIPYGLGVKVKAGPFMNIALEGGYRLVFTDYMDDVSTVHPDKTSWDATRTALSDRRPELGLQPYAAGTQRGNPDKNDGYFLLNLKMEYYLPHNFIMGDQSTKAYKKKRRSIYKSKNR